MLIHISVLLGFVCPHICSLLLSIYTGPTRALRYKRARAPVYTKPQMHCGYIHPLSSSMYVTNLHHSYPHHSPLDTLENRHCCMCSIPAPGCWLDKVHTAVRTIVVTNTRQRQADSEGHVRWEETASNGCIEGWVSDV